VADETATQPGVTPAPTGPTTPPAPTPTTAPTTAPTTSPQDDWAAETADRLDRLVTTVRTQTTDRVVSVARLLVYGLLAAITGLMAGVLGIVMLVRALDELIPQEVWLTYFVIGAILLAGGAFCWSKSKKRPAEA
jgi:hypothetical protein